MVLKKVALEIGMGTDIRGGDYTKAAVRALKDALWHNSLTVATASSALASARRMPSPVIGSMKPAASPRRNSPAHPGTRVSMARVPRTLARVVATARRNRGPP